MPRTTEAVHLVTLQQPMATLSLSTPSLDQEQYVLINLFVYIMIVWYHCILSKLKSDILVKLQSTKIIFSQSMLLLKEFESGSECLTSNYFHKYLFHVSFTLFKRGFLRYIYLITCIAFINITVIYEYFSWRGLWMKLELR